MPYSPLDLAEAFIKTGELTDALDALNEHLAQSPDDLTARQTRAAVHLRLDHLQDALDDLAGLNSPDDRLTRSTIYERMGDLTSALQAVETDTSHDRLIERRLHLMQKLGQISKARQLVESLPRTWRWSQWSGDLAAADQDFAVAVSHYAAALSTLPPIDTHALRGIAARLLLARGDAYLALEQWDAADADYAAAAVYIPDEPMIPFNRGIIRYHQGEEEAGLAQCEAAIQAAPEIMRQAMRATMPQRRSN